MFNLTPEELKQRQEETFNRVRDNYVVDQIVARCLEELATILNDNATTNGEVAIARKLAQRAKELLNG